MNNNIIKDLHQRNLIYKINDFKNLYNILKNKYISLYCGLDPTSNSLHIGHLIPLITLKRFQLYGNKPIILIGGATSLIGDPSFKFNERNISFYKEQWIKNINSQISLFIDLKCGLNSGKIINNYKWFNYIKLLPFLCKIGNNFKINNMINKKFIKLRLKNKNSLNYTEFTYNLLQSYDFLYLFNKKKVILQIGGSDQWGNIISGINLINKFYNKKVYGLTLPLFLNNQGKKFSKTETNIIWLDKNKTTPYEFYQFLLNINDFYVFKLLKYLTFIDIKKINYLEKEYINNNYLNKTKHPQILLAEEVTFMIHGYEELKIAKRITKNLFKIKPLNLKKKDILQLIKDGLNTIQLKLGVNLKLALIKANFACSKIQAKKLIDSNSITVNGRIKRNYVFSTFDILYNNYTLICKSKKHFFIICWKQ